MVLNLNIVNNNWEKIEEEKFNTTLVVVSTVGRTVVVSEGTGTVIYVKKKKTKNGKVKLNIEADVYINSKEIALNIISGSGGEKGKDEKNNKWYKYIYNILNYLNYIFSNIRY